MLTTLWAFLRRALRAAAALAAALVVMLLGVAAVGGLLLRLAWLRSRAVKGSAPPRVRRTGGSRGDVIDVEVREVRAR